VSLKLHSDSEEFEWEWLAVEVEQGRRAVAGPDYLCPMVEGNLARD